MPELFAPSPSPDGVHVALAVQQRRQVAQVARQLERKLAQVRREKVKLARLEHEARELRRELETWLRAEVPAAPAVEPDAGATS